MLSGGRSSGRPAAERWQSRNWRRAAVDNALLGCEPPPAGAVACWADSAASAAEEDGPPVIRARSCLQALGRACPSKLRAHLGNGVMPISSRAADDDDDGGDASVLSASVPVVAIGDVVALDEIELRLLEAVRAAEANVSTCKSASGSSHQHAQQKKPRVVRVAFGVTKRLQGVSWAPSCEVYFPFTLDSPAGSTDGASPRLLRGGGALVETTTVGVDSCASLDGTEASSNGGASSIAATLSPSLFLEGGDKLLLEGADHGWADATGDLSASWLLARAARARRGRRAGSEACASETSVTTPAQHDTAASSPALCSSSTEPPTALVVDPTSGRLLFDLFNNESFAGEEDEDSCRSVPAAALPTALAGGVGGADDVGGVGVCENGGGVGGADDVGGVGVCDNCGPAGWTSVGEKSGGGVDGGVLVAATLSATAPVDWAMGCRSATASTGWSSPASGVSWPCDDAHIASSRDDCSVDHDEGYDDDDSQFVPPRFVGVAPPCGASPPRAPLPQASGGSAVAGVSTVAAVPEPTICRLKSFDGPSRFGRLARGAEDAALMSQVLGCSLW